MKTVKIKRAISLLCLLFFSLFMNGQQATGYTKARNYTAEKIYLDESSRTDSNAVRTVHNIVYTDGFGFKQQEIQVNGSPVDNADLVFSYAYSTMGKIEKEYLPYAKNDNGGAFDTFSSERWSMYGAEEQPYAYHLTQYEDNPLMRVSRQMGPGKVWHTAGKSVQSIYGMNGVNEVKHYKVALDGLLTISGFYEAGKLETVTKMDEDGCQSITYTDSDKRIIQIVSVNGEDSLRTCYVYDDRSHLRYVLSPEADHWLEAETDTVDVSVLKSLVYTYEYDSRDRLISKRLPGCEPVYMIYDRRDRIVLAQDGKQRNDDARKWSYFLYDCHNRVIEEGEVQLSSEQSLGELRQSAWESARYLPEGIRTPLQYTVYDNYEPTENVISHFFVPVIGYDTLYNVYPTGLVTSVKVRLLGTDDWITETTYYDTRSRAIQIFSHYPGKGSRQTDIAYDFTGNVLKLRDKTGVNVLETIYKYDERGRLLTKVNTWNGTSSDKVAYTYDRLGRLTGKRYNDVWTESLSYNIRGWLTGIESPHFSQTLHYTDGAGTPCYNGNISSTIWKTENGSFKGYQYVYDGFSRLKDAKYGEGILLSDNVNRFDEQITNYDRNGNILSLLRYGQTSAAGYGLVDNLNLIYAGNQLQSVYDNATHSVYGNGMEFKNGATESIEYVYDENGNLTQDLNKQIVAIQYNLLDLPEKVEFENGNSISYLYSADGTKLRSTYVLGNDTTIVSYFGNAIYENDVLVRMLTSDGYITPSDDKFHYFCCDHQGNTRVVLAQNGTMEEVNDYYPFGSLLSSFVNSVQPYKYNGKELDRKSGLDWYDYGSRMYDATLGRWHTVDPMVELYCETSPYNYCGNNPVNRFDPDGMDYWSTNSPAEIARFMDALRFNNSSILEKFNFSLWDYATDVEFTGNLTFNDETNTFYSSYGIVKDGVPTRVGVSVKASNVWEGGASIDGGKGRWYRNASGSLNNVYPEFGILTFAKGIANLLYKEGQKLPVQIHHFATNKNSKYTRKMADIAQIYGLKLDEAWNKVALPHLGRHPNAYHEFVLRGMKQASREAGRNPKKFLKLYNKYVKQKVINNPNLLNKSGWK